MKELELALIRHLRKEYRIAEKMESENGKKRILEAARKHGINTKKITG